MSKALLQLDKVTLRFGGLTAVSDLDLAVADHELIGLIGPNGAGKTTVFNLITGVYQPTSGGLRMSGETIGGLKPHQLARRGLARTFQNIRLFGSMSVFDNVRAALQLHRPHGIRNALWRGRGFREGEAAVAKQVLKPETSIKMRYLMRLNAEVGSAKEANVKGYYIGGKTGTAEKVINGRYSKTKLLTDFMAVLPADKPRYLLLVMLDEPQATKETRGYATAGWNAGPTAARVIERVAPLLNIQPRFDLPKAEQMLLVSNKVTR
jgi:ABC-type sugar transport system ATPase subunit